MNQCEIDHDCGLPGTWLGGSQIYTDREGVGLVDNVLTFPDRGGSNGASGGDYSVT